MTMDDARRLSDLLVTLDDAKEWKETFEDDGEPFIVFEEVVTGKNIRADGRRGGYEGGLRMDRATAIAMMAWLQEYTQTQIAEIGVS